MPEEVKTQTVGEYRVISDLRISSRMKVGVVRDEDGRLFMAAYLNRDKLLAHYRVAIHDEDEELSLEEVDSMALEKYSRAAEEFRAVYERVKDLSHPRVAEIYKMIHDNERDVDVLISEYVSGQYLFDAAAGLAPRQMIAVFVRIFEAIGFEHRQGLLNLNLKSSSFRINLESEEPVVKLMNYGFAVPKGEYTGAIRGPDLTMAPEVAFGQRDKIDERADLYSMAALMYNCITGDYPFPKRRSAKRDLKRLQTRIDKEGSPAELKNFRDDVPDGLQHLIFTLLEKNPDQRAEFDTAAKVVNYFHEKWPDESSEMAVEHTITTSDGIDSGDEDSITDD